MMDQDTFTTNNLISLDVLINQINTSSIVTFIWQLGLYDNRLIKLDAQQKCIKTCSKALISCD